MALLDRQTLANFDISKINARGRLRGLNRRRTVHQFLMIKRIVLLMLITTLYRNKIQTRYGIFLFCSLRSLLSFLIFFFFYSSSPSFLSNTIRIYESARRRRRKKKNKREKSREGCNGSLADGTKSVKIFFYRVSTFQSYTN